MGFVYSANIIVVFFGFGFLVLNCFSGFGSHAQLLAQDEGKLSMSWLQRFKSGSRMCFVCLVFWFTLLCSVLG